MSSKEYYEKNKEKILKQQKEYAKKNAKEIREKRKNKNIVPIEKNVKKVVFLSEADFRVIKPENTYKNILIVEYEGERRVVDKETYELMPKVGKKVAMRTVV